MNRNDVVLGGGGERSPVVVVPTNWPASWNHLGARTKAERSGRVPGAARWPFPAETISRFSPSFTSSSCAPSSNKVTMYPKDLAAMEKYFLSVLTPVSERFVTQMCRCLRGVTPKVRSSVMLGHGFPVGDWNAARAAFRPSPRECGDNLRQYMYINRSRAKECLRGHYLAPCVLKYHFGAVQVRHGGVQQRVPPRDHDKTV